MSQSGRGFPLGFADTDWPASWPLASDLSGLVSLPSLHGCLPPGLWLFFPVAIFVSFPRPLTRVCVSVCLSTARLYLHGFVPAKAPAESLLSWIPIWSPVSALDSPGPLFPIFFL